jgi:hypothetical protein
MTYLKFVVFFEKFFYLLSDKEEFQIQYMLSSDEMFEMTFKCASLSFISKLIHFFVLLLTLAR